MVRVNEPNISVARKSNEENISAIKSSISEIIDALNLQASLYENLSERVSNLEESEG